MFLLKTRLHRRICRIHPSYRISVDETSPPPEARPSIGESAVVAVYAGVNELGARLPSGIGGVDATSRKKSRSLL